MRVSATRGSLCMVGSAPEDEEIVHSQLKFAMGNEAEIPQFEYPGRLPYIEPMMLFQRHSVNHF